jgi:predicted MPP superfamily phosphohydrolase
MLTLTEAAKEVGLSRPAIFNAIKRGRLSATKDAQGRFIIDPAELFRVYKPVNNITVNNDMVSLTEVNHLNQLLSMKDQLLQQVINERDDLRKRLEEESRRLTLLLTHQPETFTEQKTESKLFMKLFGRRY